MHNNNSKEEIDISKTESLSARVEKKFIEKVRLKLSIVNNQSPEVIKNYELTQKAVEHSARCDKFGKLVEFAEFDNEMTSVKELSKSLGKSESTIKNWLREGILFGFKIGIGKTSKWIIPINSVNKIILKPKITRIE